MAGEFRAMSEAKRAICVISSSLVVCALFCCSARAQVTPQRLLDSAKEPQNWLTYSGDYAGHRFSALDQINIGNAHGLVPKWAYQTMAGGKFWTNPPGCTAMVDGPSQDDAGLTLHAPP